MALEVEVGGCRDACLVDTILELYIRLEGIKCSRGNAVLIGKVEVELVVAIAYAAGDAVSALPVYIVGSRREIS